MAPGTCVSMQRLVERVRVGWEMQTSPSQFITLNGPNNRACGILSTAHCCLRGCTHTIISLSEGLHSPKFLTYFFLKRQNLRENQCIYQCFTVKCVLESILNTLVTTNNNHDHKGSTFPQWKAMWSHADE